jgi:hypothetical protein
MVMGWNNATNKFGCVRSDGYENVKVVRDIKIFTNIYLFSWQKMHQFQPNMVGQDS